MQNRHRWEYNIKMDLIGIGCLSVDSIQLDQDRDHWRALMNTTSN